jgi:hypothetical protein
MRFFRHIGLKAAWNMRAGRVGIYALPLPVILKPARKQ